MSVGPIEIFVIAFDDPSFHGEIRAELERLRDGDIIRVVDLLAVRKTEDGVIERLSLLQPGKPALAFPADCFALKIGARVRGPRGDGAVIGAQCSPANQFTQYRVQRADSVRFWAVLTELKRL